MYRMLASFTILVLLLLKLCQPCLPFVTAPTVVLSAPRSPLHQRHASTTDRRRTLCASNSTIVDDLPSVSQQQWKGFQSIQNYLKTVCNDLAQKPGVSDILRSVHLNTDPTASLEQQRQHHHLQQLQQQQQQQHQSEHQSEQSQQQQQRMPQHVAFIVDGNGRWAQQRGLSRLAGHSAGAKVTVDIVKDTFTAGVSYITLYLFSTENWSRPAAEVDNIMQLLESYLGDFSGYLVENKVRLEVIGQRHRLPPATRRMIESSGFKAPVTSNTDVAERGLTSSSGSCGSVATSGSSDSSSCSGSSGRSGIISGGGSSSVTNSIESSSITGTAIDEVPVRTLCLAISYGGRDDIVQSCRSIASQVAQQQLAVEDIDEDMFAKGTFLGLLNIPDPDLIVRTSGEFRLSNFLLWQCAYAEFASIDCFWPDLTTRQSRALLLNFASRQRRFGQSI